jgi:hypothetical protein
LAFNGCNTSRILIIITFFFLTNFFAQTIGITPSFEHQFGTKLNSGPNYKKGLNAGESSTTLIVGFVGGLVDRINKYPNN